MPNDLQGKKIAFLAFAKFFRTLSLIGTPAAVLANLLILLFA